MLIKMETKQLIELKYRIKHMVEELYTRLLNSIPFCWLADKGTYEWIRYFVIDYRTLEHDSLHEIKNSHNIYIASLYLLLDMVQPFI